MGRKALSRKPEPKRGIAWPRWTGFRGMTLRSWLELLVVPLALVVIGFLFSVQQDARQQRIEDQRAQEAQKIENQRAEAERELAEQQAQDEALQAYLDQMTSLLLEENLRESEKGSELRILAQARTATVIQALDADGNRNVIRFLQEARLTGNIHGETPSAISLLAETDLQGARLEGADLSDVDLAYTILDDAHLRGTAPEWLWNASLARADMSRTYLEDSSLVGANLNNAILRDAYLDGTNLHGASLKDADLSGAYMGGAFLRDADLSGADLSGAKGITNEELEQQALSLKGATMPKGQKYEDWLKSKDR